ncbi:otogelin-like protein [Tachyglossus aculeatus]|uniref:otogelin-like protein n=1 Tax=Tachyglossus aculeatus TaxID=9261 RepID=UPI0018F531E9|nr:otogelin-like protein [Tachyglossus aculeatus]
MPLLTLNNIFLDITYPEQPIDSISHGNHCKNGFGAIRQKRDLLAAQVGYASGRKRQRHTPFGNWDFAAPRTMMSLWTRMEVLEATSPKSDFHESFVAAESRSEGSCTGGCLNGAICSRKGTCDCRTFQALGKRCQIVPNIGKNRDGICKTWGQYHFETFDGIYYYFPGNCSYIFAKDCGHLEPQYTVWVHNNPNCQVSGYSCHRSVSLFFSSQEEITISGHEVRKRGIRLMLPQTIGYVFIERLANYILVKTTFGFSLAWDGISGLYIKLTGEHKGKPCGLCGNYNGDQSDDLVKQNYEYTEDIAVFMNSWTVQIPDDNTCIATGSDFPSPCLTKEATFEGIFFKCQILLQFPFLSCHENIDPYSYIASCINDLCKSDDEDSYCRAVTEYARACSHAGYPVRDWRDDFPACTEKCDDSFVHRDCISCCPPTCTFEKECLGSNLHCLDGCYCPDGLIMDNGTCVSLEKCPCSYHGSSYAVGSRIEQECSECVCVGGVWNCTEQECPVECSVVGDSHFTTFDGRHYTFVGVCQYILVKGTGNDKFTVTLQKAPCGQNLDLACLQSVTLVLGDDLNKQVTLSRGGEVFTGPNHGIKLNGEVEIRNLSSLFILLKTRFGLKILFAKDGQRLYIQVNSVWKRRTLGLCGTFNGNLRDDFLSPAGMIEGTPQLHANAWKVSSTCFAPVNVPVVDPCNVNQQNIGYAAQCDILNRELFAPCHAFISPGLYYHLCRFDACKCGSGCLCNALAHYAYICGKHGIVIDFRSHMSSCAVICQRGMLYHRCSSFCRHSCTSLSTGRTCDDECAEGCNCPEGKYFEESINFCVPVFSCRCHHRGSVYQPGELIPTPSGLCQCSNGTVKCAESSPTSVVLTCPEGKSFFDCKFPVPGLPAAGVNCETTCANLAMNFTCAPSLPCSSGCICPPGMAEHRGKCYVPDSCPCTWKDWEYLSGEVIATPCYTCICRRGIFNCTYHPCPAVCTVYGDRHYSSFDGLEFDYISDCQVFLSKSADDSNMSIIAQNKKCFDNDIVCSKSVLISIGNTEIFLNDTPYKQKQSVVLENKPTYQLWKAGYYAVVHFPEEDITVLWDKKTTIHIKVGPHWKGRLAGLCGNFDKYTSNDMTTSNNLEVRSAQVFGESWTIGQCENPNETVKPCEVHQSKFPYAKKECSILYSDVFAPCRNVIDVTPFVKNCHTDTCNCNLGGDCECLCTSIAAYAYKCCQQGVSVHWRSPTLCALDCEYFNQGLGEGPYILANYGHSDTVLGVDVISRKILPLPRSHTHDNAFFYFMITPGLFREKDSSLTLVSLESAERPNYFLYVHGDESITLEQWEANTAFQQTATFFHHQGLWIPGSSAFELHSKKGFFITFIDSSVKVSKYDNSEEFKQSSSFSIEEIQAAIPYRRMCEWRYEPCATPCIRTCSDPEALSCKFLPPVEGCLPYCSKNMILDEVTLKCVYPGDCVLASDSESTQKMQPTAMTPHMMDAVDTFVPGKTSVPIDAQTTFTATMTEDSVRPHAELETVSTGQTMDGLLSREPFTFPSPLFTKLLLTPRPVSHQIPDIVLKPSSSSGVSPEGTTVPDFAETSKLTSPSSGVFQTQRSQTTHLQNNITKSKSETTERSSVTELTSSDQTVGSTRKPISHAEVTNVTLSYSGIPQTFAPELDVMGLITTLPSGTQIPPDGPEMLITASADHISPGTVIHTLIPPVSSGCLPEYIEPVDRCNLYVCINMGWKLYNMSENCYKDVKIPDCGFRGMPIQVNIDDCCPEWECPCQCSMLPELSIITFAGDTMALYNLASYILVKLPGEIIIAHIEKCPIYQVSFSTTLGLCMNKLNITTQMHKVLVSRLVRKVEVDSAIQSLPFSKHGLWIQDTGAMYVIGTPSGLIIKWAHVTGILDIQYGLQFNISTKTEGLCGFCNGSPKDDLKMPNRTTIASVEEMEAFIQTWEMEKSYDVVPRRQGANCTEGDCAPCIELLNKRIFTPCHTKVSPEDFCEKMWLNSTYFWNYECDTLSAYVALCHKHNICIQWRTPDYCSLTCPEGKEYQPCVQPSVAKTCLNWWYYETVPYSYLREDCVCKIGTVLHRTHSDHCIPEGKCACTDHEGQPHSAGEVWNGACTGCCMNKCLENGSIIHIEPECSDEPHPACEQEGEVIIRIIEKTSCCLKTVCNCNMTLCESVPPTCKKSEKLVSGYNPLSCCPQYRCECDPLACLSALQPECRDDQFIVEIKQEDTCCFSNVCVCDPCTDPIPQCMEGEILTVDLKSTRYCCPKYYCVCEENRCSIPVNCTADMKLVKEEISGQCCPAWHCECSCGNLIIPTCKVGEVQKIDPNFQSACGCIQYSCEKDNVCLFQEVTVLNPRQSLIQYLDGELCQTIHCLEEKDYKTGYHTLDFTVENCSKQCEAYQIYNPPSSHDICCGSCKNVSCGFYTENGTKAVYEAGTTWTSNCTKYECAKTSVGAVLLSSEVICPNFNETECIKNGGLVHTYNEGCCKTCKREEKVCQKVTVRTTIRKQDCISQSPINVASCDGKCPSATIYNINIDSHLRFCKCCRENGVRNFTVPLFCLGNGTEVMFSIQEPTDCFCQWN